MNLSEKLKENTKNLTVLYVEDEDDTRSQISQILELFFKNVYVGINGLDALKIYKEKHIDLVMTDLTMPKMNGLEMIKEMKKTNINQHVIVLTAHNSSENLMETMDLQIDGFLLKPMKMDKMLSLLHKITHTINLEKREKSCIQ
ncbi:MAG: response regulator [Campylobacterota bacterium]|nr:response regulator [Campylobacterota bacterium]